MFTKVLNLTLVASLASAAQLEANLAANLDLNATSDGYYCTKWNLEYETDKDTCADIGGLQQV